MNIPACRRASLRAALLWGELCAGSIVHRSSAQVVDLPPLIPPSTTQQSDQSLSATDTVVVREFRFEGNTVFTTAQLREVVKDYVGRRINSDDLEDARRKLSQLYVDKGFISSGVVLPDQTLPDQTLPDQTLPDQTSSGNTVLFRVVEGKLRRADIELSGVDAKGQSKKLYLRRSYIIDRILAGAGKVLNLINLKAKLDLLRQDPNIKRINAELQPGAAPGESHLDVRVEETQPYHFSVDFNNRRPPSVGAEEVTGRVWTTDLTGNGDSLNLDYTAFTGTFDREEFSNLDNFDVDYAIPLTPSDTTFDVSFGRTNSPVVEDPFNNLNIKSDTQSTALTLRQPLARGTTASFDNYEFDVFVTGSFRQNKTTLLGTPFTFTPGAVNGTSRVTAIRVGQELSLRNQQQAISFRSTLSVGLSALGSTVHGDDTYADPDSQFVDWLGQFQYVRRLFDTDNQFIFRTDAQISDDPLLSLEQFSLGGFDTVRGYRENEYIRDDAIASTFEFRFPVPGIPKHEGASALDVAPFADLGYAQNTNGAPNGNEEFISSIGVGLLFHPNEHVDFQIYYGYPFRDTHLTSDLQDIGIHFDLLVTAF